MDIREGLFDGVTQLNEWTDEAIKDLSPDQLNHISGGKTVSIGFNAWHVMRTQDNITNFVLQRKTPIWMEQGYVERFGLPKVEQGTGMGLDDAHAITISDVGLLREYGKAVAADTLAFLRDVDPGTLMVVQMSKPLGEMPRWRVFRMVVMTHGFMHLGEINHIKGELGLQFFL
jgi:hypothetical protein